MIIVPGAAVLDVDCDLVEEVRDVGLVDAAVAAAPQMMAVDELAEGPVVLAGEA
ncbi:hypothetical protein ABZV81_23420 [Streptomyces parvus]|uniref:hypothetical protein n=1 Tax=Streptomyces parvus TaxID=66428 RepID=UPI0033BE9688